MDIAEIIIIICCAVIIIMLGAVIALLVRRGGGSPSDTAALTNQSAQIKEYIESGNKVILDQLGRQDSAVADTVKRNVDILGGKLESEQKNMREMTASSIREIGEDVTGLRKENKESLDGIKSIVTEKMQDTLNSRLGALNNTITTSISELGKNLRDEQEKQLRMINENMDKLRAENKESLDKINGTVNEKLQETLDKKISESFKTVSEQLMSVSKGLGEMQSVAVNITDLRKVLSNVKTRGNFGEVQLAAILEEILTPDQYVKQTNVSGSGRELVDFAVKLPGADGGEPVYLPIDSKFPADTFAALIDAVNSGNTEDAEERRRKLYMTMRDEAKSIHDKYIAPPRTTDFAIMFLPSEGLYSEAVSTPGLVDELQRNYRVNIAGPSTMAAMLSSLRMGFQTLKIQQKSSEIQTVLEAAKKEFGNFEKVLENTRKRLKLADDELEKLVSTRTRAINRALKSITGSESLEDAQDIIDAN